MEGKKPKASGIKSRSAVHESTKLHTWGTGHAGASEAPAPPICPMRRVGATCTRHAHPGRVPPLRLRPLPPPATPSGGRYRPGGEARAAPRARLLLPPATASVWRFAALRRRGLFPSRPPTPPPPPLVPSCARRLTTVPSPPPPAQWCASLVAPPAAAAHDAEADEDGCAGQPQHCRAGWAARGSSRCVRWGERGRERGRGEGEGWCLCCRRRAAAASVLVGPGPPRRCPCLPGLCLHWLVPALSVRHVGPVD